MASSATHNALDIPIYGAAFNVPLVWLDADGDPTLPVSLDIEVSKDNGTFANASNSAVLAKEVGGTTDSAYGYLTLTASEMTCDLLLGQAKDSTQKATPFTLRPKRLPVVRDDQCAGGAASTVTLDGSASAVDDYYNGCIIFLDADTGAGQARRVLDYAGDTKVATVAGTWQTNPDATTDYQMLATPEWLTALNTRAILALPPYAPAGANGLPTVGTGAGQINVAGGRADGDMKYLFGSALSEGAAGRLAAAFVKWLNVATPTGTVNSIPDALPNSAGGLPIVDANGRTDVNLEAVLGTVLTETVAGYLAAAIKKLFDVATPVLTAASVNQTGDAYGAVAGALPGSPTDGSLQEVIKTTLLSLSNRANNADLNALLGVEDTIGLTVPDMQDIRDAMKLAPTSGAPTAGSVDKHLDDILEDTGTTLPALIGALSPGTGARTVTCTITDAISANPVVGVTMRYYSNSARTSLVALATGTTLGVVQAWLDDGTYYWAAKATGYEEKTGTVVVDGNESNATTMTPNSVDAADAADAIRVFLYPYDAGGSVDTDLSPPLFTVRLSRPCSTTNGVIADMEKSATRHSAGYWYADVLPVDDLTPFEGDEDPTYIWTLRDGTVLTRAVDSEDPDPVSLLALD
jgi:hypothetical protein